MGGVKHVLRCFHGDCNVVGLIYGCACGTCEVQTTVEPCSEHVYSGSACHIHSVCGYFFIADTGTNCVVAQMATLPKACRMFKAHHIKNARKKCVELGDHQSCTKQEYKYCSSRMMLVDAINSMLAAASHIFSMSDHCELNWLRTSSCCTKTDTNMKRAEPWQLQTSPAHCWLVVSDGNFGVSTNFLKREAMLNTSVQKKKKENTQPDF